MLPVLALPEVRVLSSDFDEVPLPPGSDVDAVLDELTRPVASVGTLGMERKQPAVTLSMRLVSYDPERQVVRRYRRLVVAVDYPAPSAVSPAAQRIATAARGPGTTNPHVAVDRSVLADGIVYKIPITEEGIYRIDRAFLAGLPGLEIDLGSIDPNNVRVFGNGGQPVPALNSAPRPADLLENRTFVQGGGDGTFNDGDAVFFYASGPTGWVAEPQTRSIGGRLDTLRDEQNNILYYWKHYVHPFSNENYYFIKIDTEAGAHVEQAPYPNHSGATQLSQIRGRHFVDFDQFMWSRERGGTGHTYVSNLIEFGGGSMPVLENVALPGLTGGTVEYLARPAVQANPATPVFFRSEGTLLQEVRLSAVGNSSTQTVANTDTFAFSQSVGSGATLNLTMTLGTSSGNAKAALDWVRVFYPKALQASDNMVRFHTPLSQTGVFEMTLSGFSQEPQVWDVTDPGDIRRLGVQAAGGSYRVQVVVEDRGQPRELIAFTTAAAQTLVADSVCPEDGGCRVATQNLHGITSHPQFVIVTPQIFRTHAEQLADRRRQDGLSVEVVDVQAIYNEFSGGLTDPRGLRDFFKFLYDRAPDDASRLRYVLLFGDGHYNYRGIGEDPMLTNWIVPFETEESFHPEESFTSDDYFGLLDDNEGLWPFTRTTFGGSNSDLNERIDLGIGRFTVHTASEAAIVLDKIQRYESGDTYASWRSRYLFVADDGPTGLSGSQDDYDLHLQNTDVVAEVVDDRAPEINQKKVYGVSYERVFQGITRIPGAHQDIIAAIREGVLAVNYSGHGGIEGLAQEEIFTREDAINLDNGDRLPIFITATCSFGRWDLSDEQSGAEELLLNPNGGGIAILTTVRTVYTSATINSLNVGLNVELNRQIFEREANGSLRRLGDILRETKNTQVGYQGNNRKFNLLGDPTMRPGVPALNAVVQTVNGIPVNEQVAPVRALDQLTIEGEIQRADGSLVTDFNGEVVLTVFDAQRRVPIPEHAQYYLRNRPYYTVREDLLWRGKVNATSGRYTATFVVPKDISYSNELGRISAYAVADTRHALGYTDNVRVGGTVENPPDDTEGPEITLYLEEESFASGGLTSPQPVLFVELFDEHGVNTVGAGVGHEMLLVVDDDEQNAINIGDLYEAKENSFREGTVRFQFEEELSTGPHTLSVRAWDVLNNSGTSTLDFTVAERASLALTNVFNYPNPTTGPTRFVFEHNQPAGTPASVQIRIYTLSGRPIRTIEHEDVLPSGPMPIAWDGRDDDFDPLSSGVYLYKVRVEIDGPEGERQVSEKIEKIAVIR